MWKWLAVRHKGVAIKPSPGLPPYPETEQDPAVRRFLISLGRKVLKRVLEDNMTADQYNVIVYRMRRVLRLK